MFVGARIQQLTKEWLQAWYTPFGFKEFGVPGFRQYPYAIDPSVRLNSGLTLESALLFNLPTYQPADLFSRSVRLNQTKCNAPFFHSQNDLSYLDNFPVSINSHLQGLIEAPINPNNGVRTTNRGSGDTISILIRRSRELGMPSFTDIRDAIAQPAHSKCVWNTWTDTATCNATALFKHSAYAQLKKLYPTPGDVELIVGSLLSDDRVPASLSPELNRVGIDQTQAWLIFGEIERIISLDVFSVDKSRPGPQQAQNAFFGRLQLDDPNPSLNSWTSIQINFELASNLYDLINKNTDNTALSCYTINPFNLGGWDMLVDGDGSYENLFVLPHTQTPDSQRANCDISQTTKDAFDAGNQFGVLYSDIFCPPDDQGFQGECFRPALPFCVD